MKKTGVRELKAEMSKHYFDNAEEINLSDMVEIHHFLDSFFLSRIGIRMLIGQHIELQKEDQNKDHVVSFYDYLQRVIR